MSSEWKSVTLGDVLEVKHGWPFKSDFFSPEIAGRPIVVAIGNFQYTGGFRFESTNTKEYLGAYPKQYELKPRDILLVMTCQTEGGEILGIPARVPDDGRVYLHNQRMGKIVVTRPDILDLDFVYWVCLWKDFNEELVASSSGTKIKHTAPTRIERFRLWLPALDEQRAITRILSALDDKIELNLRMNRTLEELAGALFRAWFVDFEPVVAKAAGRAPFGLTPQVAGLFPSTFEDSELGPIPRGWRTGKVNELATMSRGGINPGDFPKETFDHYSIPAFDDGQRPKPELGNTIKSNKYPVPADCVMVSKLNPRTPRVWMPELTGENRAICSTEFLVMTPRSPMTRDLLYCLFSSDGFTSEFATLVTGTSGSHQRVMPENLLSMDAVILPGPLVERFTEIVRPWLAQVAHNIRESRTLASLRDTLLPKLLSGEIRVKGAERMVEGAV